MRKISGLERAALVLTALCAAFSAGWLAKGVTDPQPVLVERTALTAPSDPSAAADILPAPSASPSPDAGTPAPVSDGKINLNTADAEALQTLPGIGEKRAQAILDDREANGPFRIPEDITRVEGIGEGILENIMDYITVE